MSRKKKVLRNTIILILLSFILLRSANLYLTPLSAHKAFEKSKHYGPSEVVHIENFNGDKYKGKYILSKYDKYISCIRVERKYLLFWRIRNQFPPGIENYLSQSVFFLGSGSGGHNEIWGIVNDDRIKKIEVINKSGEIFTETKFYDDMFIITWKSENGRLGWYEEIKGYDGEGKLIYEGR